MSYIRTKGVVIKEVELGEADKIVTIISEGHGKISAFAKGSRRNRSKIAAGTQLFCYSDMILFKGKGMYHLNSCEVIEPFYSIRNDVVTLTYASHIVEILNDVVQENQPSRDILELFLNTLYMLTRKDKNPELITRIFEIRLLSISGYAPHVAGCMVCNSRDVENLLFSFKKCGFICSRQECLAEDRYAVNILPGTVRALHHIVNSNKKDLFSFDISPEVLRDLGKISQRYLRDRLEKDYTKLDFLKTLKKL